MWMQNQVNRPEETEEFFFFLNAYSRANNETEPRT